MKLILSFLVWFLGIFGLFAGIVFSYTYIASAQAKDSQGILSPISEASFESAKTLGSYAFWKPKTVKQVIKKIPEPQLSAVSAISYDITTDSLLYSKNSDQKLPMASLTKIMTAVVVLENMDIHDEIKISRKAANIGENSMGLTENEEMSVEDLLYGLILVSGNDAAESLAQESPFGREKFIHVMNSRAERLGLSNTRFTNPSGLNGDGEQYTTAQELLMLSRYALTFDEFAKVASTLNHDIPKTAEHKEYSIPNLTNLMTSYPGVKGLKTGYTEEAGMCLVTYLEQDGHKIIAVVLNSADRRAEMKELLDYSLKSIDLTPPKHS